MTKSITNKTAKRPRIGVLSAGGDCPGINAAIRSVGKTAIFEYGMKVFGFSSGFTGLINNEYLELKDDNLSGILTQGGTILGTSREKPFKKANGTLSNSKPSKILKTYKDLRLDALVCIGGNGTMKTASGLSELGLNVVGIPKTIDNDVWGTEQTFGFDSALSIATEAIDRLHTTANSHRRIMVIEVMGHNAGWLALYAGIAGGGDIILIPEIPYNESAICNTLLMRAENRKPYSIVVVAEGIEHPKGETAAHHIAGIINTYTGLETRETILGYIQRGGAPTAPDRILATRFGAAAVELIVEKKFGRMVSITNNKITSVDIAEAGSNVRLVPKNHSLIPKARRMNICFGEKAI